MSNRLSDREDVATSSPLLYFIATAADTVVAEVRPGSRLIEDLGVDSLEMAALLVDIENHYEVVITADVLAHIHTVADLQHAVEWARSRIGE